MFNCFLYVSVSCLEEAGRDQHIADLVHEARVRNEANDVTGTLVFSGTRFAQYLEGPPVALREIVTSILGDRRHSQVNPLRDCPIYERQFAGWALCYSGPSLYVDRHIKSLINAPRNAVRTAIGTDQLFRLMLSLNETQITTSGPSTKAESDYTL